MQSTQFTATASSSRGFVLPVPSNQKMNDYLKKIAVLCGIDKVLTSHVARHTFATTITLQNGVPIESVSKYNCRTIESGRPFAPKSREGEFYKYSEVH